MMNFTAYGLSIESEIELPELRPHSGDRADIRIRYATVPGSVPEPKGHGVGWQAAAGKFLLNVEGIARYFVLNGREIQIERSPHSRDDDVRAFLLGSVLGALMHQRNILTMHCSAVQTRRGAVLFMGHSGQGKSTLLGALLRRGYAMLADDKAGIVLDENGCPQVLPGFPVNRLCADTLSRLGYSAQHLTPTRAGLGKYVIPVDSFCADPLRLHAAYELTTSNQPEIRLEPVRHARSFEIVARNVYRPTLVRALGLDRDNFSTVVAVGRKARVARITRPADPFLLDELVAKIEEDLNQPQ